MASRLTLFNIKNLQSRLISQRVKLAKKRHDADILDGYVIGVPNKKPKKDRNPRFINDKRIFELIMPTRRSWIHLNEKSRYKGEDKNRITSLEQNRRSLELTLERDSRNNLPYMQLQVSVLRSLRKQIFNNKYEFQTPEVNKNIKNDKELRPVCSFPIFDNIILQECNRILSRWFDSTFCDSSYAFRVKTNRKKAPTHHDTIRKIREYINSNQTKKIYVAECDLKKFYDSINHKVIIDDLDWFLERVEKHEKDKKVLRHLFLSYLNCYDFQKSVLPLNKDSKYLESTGKRIFKGICEKDLAKIYGEDYKKEKIGVPQGGALSGLIANIILHSADNAIQQLGDNDLLYLRFCDDMIMLHTNQAKLTHAFNIYQEKLIEKKLFIHEPVKVENYSAQYYKSKSKLPFCFGSQEDEIPWITFVGYDINYLNEVRVRKKTVTKEIKKQEELVDKIFKTVKSNDLTISKSRIIESARQRLIGMSVGRIVLWGDNLNKEMCWAKGFPCLTKNQYSFRQMKRLDRSRRKQIRRLYANIPTSKANKKDIPKKKEPIVYYGKPFSYYYWLENKDEGKNER